MTEPLVPVEAAHTHKSRKLSAAQWNEAILLWKAGEITLRGLSEKFGISTRRFTEKFSQLGVKKGELLARQQAAAEQALVLEPTELAKRIFETKDETYRIIQMLRKSLGAEFMKARRDGKAFGTIVNDVRAIRDAAAAIRTCREEAYAVLGIKEDDESDLKLPELMIRGLTQDEITDLQDSAIEDTTLLMEQMARESDAESAMEADVVPDSD